MCKDCGASELLVEFAKSRGKNRLRCLACYNARQRPANRARNKKRYQNPDYKERLRAWQRRWNKTPRGRTSRARNKRHQRENPVMAFADRLSGLLRKALNERGIRKDKRTRELVGYSPEDLYNHLRKYIGKKCGWCGTEIYNWMNCSIDHIIPLHTAKTKEDVLKLNELSNLRLLHFDCNLKKGGKLPTKKP